MIKLCFESTLINLNFEYQVANGQPLQTNTEKVVDKKVFINIKHTGTIIRNDPPRGFFFAVKVFPCNPVRHVSYKTEKKRR